MLDEILRSTRARVKALTEGPLREAARGAPPVRPLAAALAAGGPAVIAEVKRRSPSRGVLAPDLDPARLAAAYQTGGAAAVSVLTEPDYFGGSHADLAAVRRAVTVPVLCKDFVLAPAQVWQARESGADAVLLIAAALTDAELAGLLDETRTAGMEALVEVHTAAEAGRARAAGATVVGVNNRDLATFRVDLATAERLAPLLADVPVRVAESGIDGPAACRRMAAAGYQAVLVGESLVTSGEPAAAVAAMAGDRTAR